MVTALITLLSTLMSFWNIEEYWLQNIVIEQQLISLNQKFKFECADISRMTTTKMDDLFQELQAIIGQQNTYWKNALEDVNTGGEE